MFRNLCEKLDPPADYVGQMLATKLMYMIYTVGYTLSLLAGIIYNDLVYTLYIGIGTFIVSLIVVVPPWKIYRKHPLKFRKPQKAKKD